MTDIQLINDNGVIKGIDPETGEEVSVEMQDLGVGSLNAEVTDLTEPAVYAFGGDGQVQTAVRASDYANGGEAIQAAITALPPEGGRVYIPSNGPDDGVVDGGGNQTDGVWAVRSDITTDPDNVDRSGVTIHGDSPGWNQDTHGTSLICDDGTVGSMLKFDGQLINTLYGIRFDGGGDATHCVDYGGTSNIKDFQTWNIMVSFAAKDNLRLTGSGNVWVRDIWTEKAGRSGIRVENNPTEIRLHDVLSFDNGDDISLVGGTGESVDRLWIKNLRTRRSVHGISMGVDVNYGWIKDVIVSDNTGNGIQIDGTISNCWFEDIYFDDPNVNLNRTVNFTANGTTVDCSFRDFKSEDIANSNLYDYVDDPAESTRSLIDGIGRNGSNDPASAGAWNGSGKDGVLVKWDDGAGNHYLSVYRGGQWWDITLA